VVYYYGLLLQHDRSSQTLEHRRFEG
jgi:hypothetical protein